MYLEDLIYYMTPILSLLNFIILIVVLCKISGKKDAYQNISERNSSPSIKAEKPISNSEAGVVFCKNCGNQYYSTSAVCPNCRTPH